MHLRHLLVPLFAAVAVAARADIVINELMYHPASENPAEEYIELKNTGLATVDVSGWQFTSGIAFTMPVATTIPAGGYLVVAANSSVFSAKYPGVTNFVAGWIGKLSNSSNNVVLANAAAVVVDSVHYSDDADWAERRRDDPPDFGHRGWDWHSDADGFGKSLELINAAFDNDEGQNWAASTPAQGTPGAANSVAAADIAPVIDKAEHFPLVPKSVEGVTVICRVRDDHAAAPTVQLHYRNEDAPSFTTATMFDDGAHGDGAAGDGYFGATILPKGDGVIVEFYFTASDGSLTRTWPAPARDYTGTLVQTQNCLYQVDDTPYAGAMPYYRMVMRAVDRDELTQINTNSPAAPFPTSDQTESHAKMNTTWITSDGTSTDLHYLTGVRNRGHGSRTRQPQSFAINFTNENPWKGVVSMNLNTQHTDVQLFGSALFRAAGLTCPDSRQVQLRVNGVDPTGGSTSSPSFGFYCANEVENSEFADHHYPLDSSGNIYRSQRLDSNAQQGDFSYIDNNPDSYRPVYFKQTNASEDDWSDLISLCLAFSKGHSDANFDTTYDLGYEAGVQAHADVTEWMRYFAVNTIVDNSETALSNGYGDDFYFYFGVNDPHATLTPYDLDTICGQGDNRPGPQDHGLFRMVNRDDNAGNGPAMMNSFIKNPTFAPIYYDELNQQLHGAFATANFNALVDEILTGVVPSAPIASIKNFQATRSAYLATLIPLNISVTNSQTVAGDALPTENGLIISVLPNANTTPANVPNADPAHCKLIGKANAITTRSVKVNGVAATWSAWQATWTADSVALAPGINKILIQAFDGSNVETERFTQDIWRDDGSVANKSGNAITETWTPAAGPYQITAAFTVPNGVTLTIQPGTTVYVASGINITVANGGKILAEGTETQHVRFTKIPGSTNWGGLTINGAAGSPETRIAYADFDSNTNVAVVCAGATVYLDHLNFGNPAQAYIHLDGSSFIVSNCVFPNTTAAVELVHGTGGVKAGGYGIVRDCFFGTSVGYSDIVDFTGGSRPSTALIQFYNNVFMGSTDDMLDLDGTDAWVEGNIFMHCHKNGSPDTSAAVSGGEDQGATANKSEVTIIGNIFFDCDNAATAKEGNFYTLINNTIVHQSRTGGTEARAGVVNLADDGIAQAAGMYLEANIILDIEALERSYVPALTSILTFNNNILPMAWSGAGTGNTVVDPRLKYLPLVSETNFPTFQAAQVMRDWFSLLPGSPAIGTGPNGRDKGGVISHGASVFGEPTGTTNATSATLTVGSNNTGFGIPTTPWPNGSGFTHYQYKLDAGAFSAERTIGTAISLSGLANGAHKVTVIGKNDVGLYQNDPKLGADGTVTVSKTWTVDTSYVPPPLVANVRLNEVLAKNTETLGFSGTFPDILELYNAGGATANITGWGLTDNATLPYKYTFPSTTIAPGAYLVVYLSNSGNVPPTALKTGFSVKDAGDTITLTKSAAAGGGVVDSIPFGAQLPDYSIGRRATDGQWDMCRPTFGAANVVAAQETPNRLLINEWLANEQVLANTDFIELFNTSPLPVNIGGCYLTDNPVEYITQHPLRQLTFIAPSGYAWFKADGDPGQGPDHLNFKLSAEQGEIGFFDVNQKVIDRIIYGPQSTDVSQGRSPNGALTFAFFNQPTPGGPNPGNVTGGTTVVTLIPATQTWKYYANNASAPPADGQGHANYYETAYVDTTWSSGASLLYIENATTFANNTPGFAKTTLLPPATVGSPNTTPYQTYYFRTHFNVDVPPASITSLTAQIICDDGCVLFLNGQELVPSGGRVRMAAAAPPYGYTVQTTGIAPDATVETITLPKNLLVQGDNVLAVEVHQTSDQGGLNPSSDITWAMKLDAATPAAGATSTIVLNEILADNLTLQNPDGSYSGWIEIYNTSGTDVDISDVSLTDDTSDARKWVFPSGSSVPANGFLVVYCNPLAAASTTNVANMNTGFGLNSTGDRVFLFRKLVEGGGLQDSVNFGQQVPDRSVGRITNGVGGFTLNTVTRGTTNTAASLGAIGSVKINEWLANPSVLPSWFELYNSAASPVLLSGFYLTDNLNNRTKYLVPPLTFVGGTASSGNSRWLQFLADNDGGATPNHVNFSLDPGESIGIFFSGVVIPLDAVAITAQSSDVSQGRYPDGASAIISLVPTPGSANAQPIVDTDMDGIPDAWETANGLNPNDPNDAVLDADGDGQSNRAEYLAGTNPHSGISRLAAMVVPAATPGQVAVRFTAIAGKTYTVRYKTDLTAATWTKLLDVPAQGADTLIDATDNGSGGQVHRFYQVVTPVQP